jgi:AGCS family alanine or glycine:cation symporter
MAHAAADTDSPARQGLFGLVEVFVDTVLLCSITALCILVSDTGANAFGEDVTRTAQAAFSSVLGAWAGGFFALSILLFGVATVICWGHYGLTCVEYLTGGRRGARVAVGGFIVILALTLTLGAVTVPALAWSLADAAVSVMTLLNLVMLLCMSREVKDETETLLGGGRGPRACISCKENHPERRQP